MMHKMANNLTSDAVLSDCKTETTVNETKEGRFNALSLVVPQKLKDNNQGIKYRLNHLFEMYIAGSM